MVSAIEAPEVSGSGDSGPHVPPVSAPTSGVRDGGSAFRLLPETEQSPASEHEIPPIVLSSPDNAGVGTTAVPGVPFVIGTATGDTAGPLVSKEPAAVQTPALGHEIAASSLKFRPGNGTPAGALGAALLGSFTGSGRPAVAPVSETAHGNTSPLLSS